MEHNPFDAGYYGSDELRQFGFASVGENVRIAKTCNVVGLGNIAIGDNVRVDGFTTIIAMTGRVTLGSYIHIGGYTHLSAADELVFEDFTGTSQSVRIYTANEDYSGRSMANPMIPPQLRNVTRAPVRLERHAMLGAGVTVLPGAIIAEGCAVGAHSLVTKSLKPWGIYFGCPARRLKSRSRQIELLEQAFLRGETPLSAIFPLPKV